MRAYASHFKLKIVAGCPVHRVRMDSGAAWLVESACGIWRCRAVVIAVGQYGIPLTPSWPGRETYRGRLSHSADYTSGRPYAGKRVLVVGIGNSGAEIATDLADQGAAFVAISIRTPPPIVARDPFGMPAQRSSLVLSLLPPKLADRLARAITRLAIGDLARYGMPPAAWWPYSASSVPVIDVGFVAALKRGQIHIRPPIDQLSETGAIFADGRAEPFDAVIAATGFRTGLEQLIDLPGALNCLWRAGLPIRPAHRIPRPVLHRLYPQPARAPVRSQPRLAPAGEDDGGVSGMNHLSSRPPAIQRRPEVEKPIVSASSTSARPMRIHPKGTNSASKISPPHSSATDQGCSPRRRS